METIKTLRVTSNEYQGKSHRLNNRILRDIVIHIRENGSFDLEEPLGLKEGTFIKIGDMGDYEILGVAIYEGVPFVKTKFGNIMLDDSVTQQDLINILKFLECRN